MVALYRSCSRYHSAAALILFCLVFLMGSHFRASAQSVESVTLGIGDPPAPITSIIGGNTLKVTVTLSSAVSANTTLQLTATPPFDPATMSPSDTKTVTMLAGNRTHTFDWETAIVPAARHITIRATLNNSSQQAELDVLPCSLAGLTSLQIDTGGGWKQADSTVGGWEVRARLVLNGPAVFNGQTFRVASDTPRVRVFVDGSEQNFVTVPFTKTSQEFVLRTETVPNDVTARITAYQESTQRYADLTLKPRWLKQLLINNSASFPFVVSVPKDFNTPLRGKVILNAPAPSGGLSLNLGGVPGMFQVPATMNVAAGQIEQTFDITLAPDPLPATGNVLVAYGSLVSSNDTLTAAIRIQTRWIQSLLINNSTADPYDAFGIAPLTGKIILNGAPTRKLQIPLSISDTNVAKVPSVLNFEVGETFKEFVITPQPTTTTRTATLRATPPSFNQDKGNPEPDPEKVTRGLRVNPVSHILTLTDSRLLTYTTVGGLSVTGWVSLNGLVSRTQPTPISLSSNKPEAIVPATISIPADATEVSFPISTSPVTVSTEVTLKATYTVQGVPVDRTATLYLEPGIAGGSGTALTVNSPVRGGTQTTGTLTLNATPAQVGLSSYTVTLSSSNSGVAAPTAGTLTFAANERSKQFSISTNAVAADTPVTITAQWAAGTNFPAGQRQATLMVLPAALTSLSLSHSSVKGGDATPVVEGTLTLDGSVPPNTTLTVSIDNSAQAPARIGLQTNPVPAQTSVQVPVATNGIANKFYVATSRTGVGTDVTFRAQWNATQQTAVLRVNPVQLQSFTLTPNTIIGGTPEAQSVEATIELDRPAPAGGANVVINAVNSQGKPSRIISIGGVEPDANGNIVLAFTGGQQQKTVRIATRSLRAAETVMLTANYNNSISRELFVSAVCLLSFTLQSNAVQAGTPTIGTLLLNAPAPDGGEEVEIVSADPNRVRVPRMVFIPGGSWGATFPVETRAVFGSVGSSVEISASLICVTKKQTLNLLPAAPPCPAASLGSLVINPSSIIGGAGSTGTVTLAGNAPAGGQLVLLSSNDPAVLIDGSVLIAANAQSANFAIRTKAVSQTRVATITAYSAGQFLAANLTLNPGDGSSAKRPGAFTQGQQAAGQIGGESGIPVALLKPSLLPLAQAKTPDEAAAIRAMLRGQSRLSARPGDFIQSNDPGGQDRLIPGLCGPMDVVFVLDTTGSMQPSLDNIKTDLGAILGDIVTLSGNDYRLGLVTFNGSSGADYVQVDESLAAGNYQSVFGKIAALKANDGSARPESSNEALRTVVANLPQNLPSQRGNFTEPFRSNARKVVILVTDAPPGGFNNSVDPADLVMMNATAQLAAAKGIQISIVHVASWIDGQEVIEPYLADLFQSVTSTTNGIYDIAYANGVGTDLAIEAALHQCGGYEASQIIYTREDRTAPYASFALSPTQPVNFAAKDATFDLSGVARGEVTSIHVRRAGLLTLTPANQPPFGFDLQWGIRSTRLSPDTPAPDAWGAIAPSAHAAFSVFPNGYSYDRSWFLPTRPVDPAAPSFHKEIELARGLWYSLTLIDRIASACGTFQVQDTPGLTSPYALTPPRNVLTFLVKPKGFVATPSVLEFAILPQIGQGSALDITLPGKDQPEYGEWEIRHEGSVVASSGNPGGWNVEYDRTVYRGVWVSVPPDAPVGASYQVRFRGTDEVNTEVKGSGAFDVVAMQQTGDTTIRSLTFDWNPVPVGKIPKGTVTLSRPAPRGGIVIALTSNHPSILSVPPTVTVDRGKTQATFQTVKRELDGVEPPAVVEISASFNGGRTTPVIVLRNFDGRGTLGAPLLTATPGNSKAVLQWTQPAIGLGRGPEAALRYNLRRSLSATGPFETIFLGLPVRNYEDRTVVNGITYYYRVNAVDAYDEGPASNTASVTPYGGTVATPVIDPNGGAITPAPPPAPGGRTPINLSSSTRGAIIRYTLDGSMPNETSRIYAGPFSPSYSETGKRFTVKARAFRPGWIPSGTAAATFYHQDYGMIPTPEVTCGDVIPGALEPRDPFSWRTNSNRYADRYLINIPSGRRVILRLRSTAFSTCLALYRGSPGTDGNQNGSPLVAESNVPNSTDVTLDYTPAMYPPISSHVIEVSSNGTQTLGDYTLEVTCDAGVPPSVQIVRPINGQQFDLNKPIRIDVLAYHPQGTAIQRVDFYADSDKIGTTTVGNLYSMIWANAPVGAHELRAIAVDSTGRHATSEKVTISVRAPAATVPIGCGETREGQLTLTDAMSTLAVDGQHFSDRYTFTGAVGQKIVIRLRSDDFDTRVYLIAPNGSILVNSNDGISTNSQIVIDGNGLPFAGEYTIEVTSDPAGQTGLYRLSLMCSTTGLSPDLQVLSEGSEVASGGSVDFGSTPQDTAVSRRIVLRNLGLLNLNLTGITIPGGFAMTDPPRSPIAPGEETQLTIKFNAQAAVNNAQLLLYHNAPTDPSPYVLNLNAAIAPPVTLSSVTVATVPNSSTYAASGEVNGGTATTGRITLSAAAPQGGFTVALSALNEGTTTPAAEVSVPASVVVPANATSVDFAITTQAVTGQKNVTIKAEAGSTQKTATLTVKVGGTPPTITLAQPAGSPFSAPATIDLTATATTTQTGAIIQRVEFFRVLADNSLVKIGEGTQQDGTNQWNMKWARVASGTHTLKSRAADNAGRTADSNTVSVTVSNLPQLPAPIIQIKGSPSATSFYDTAEIEILPGNAAISDNVIYYTLDGTDPDPITNPSSTVHYRGTFFLRATTTVKAKAYREGYDPSGIASRAFTRSIPGGSAMTAVAITAPADSQTQTAIVSVSGLTKVRGSVNGAGKWRLSYRPVGSGNSWITLAVGKTDTAQTDFDLAMFDPTLLLNGLYEIRLEGTKPNNDPVTPAVISVMVEGQLKVGHFTFSVTDMTLPTGGIPIQVVRTYDSRDKTPGDFGRGWTLSLRNVKMQTLAPVVDGVARMGNGWQVFRGTFGTSYVAANAEHALCVTLPEGQVLAWVPVFVADNPFGGIGYVSGRILWAPATREARRATLAVADNTPDGVIITSTEQQVKTLDDDGTIGGDVYDPKKFVVTLRNGTKLSLDAAQGLTHLQDRNGNTTDFSQLASQSQTSVVETRNFTGDVLRKVTVNRTGAGGRITSITDARGNSVRYEQTGDGLLAAVTSRVGATTRYEYEPAFGNLSAIITPSGKIPLRNQYTFDGRLAVSTDALGKSVGYQYERENNGNLKVTAAGSSVQIADRTGVATTTRFNASGNVTRVSQPVTQYTNYGVDPAGAYSEELRTAVTYGDQLNPDLPTRVEVGNPFGLGRETYYRYNAMGDVISVEDARTNRTEYSVNTFGDVTRVVGPDLKVLSETDYDLKGNPIRQRDALGNITRTEYTPNGQVMKVTDPAGNATAYTYDPFGSVKTITDASGNTTEYAYDANGNRTATRRSRTLPNGTVETMVTQTVFDAEDRPLASLSPTGGRSETRYNADGQVAATQDATGRVTRYGYTAQGQRERTIYPDGTVARVEYDDNGRVKKTVNKDGTASQTEYDQAGRAIRTKRLKVGGTVLATEQTGYNILSDVQWSRDARNTLTEFDYDRNGNLLTTNVMGTRNQTTVYDVYNRPVSVTDALGRTTQQEYNSASQVIATQYADGTRAETRYDGLGRVGEQINENGEVTRFTYTPSGQLASVTDAMGAVTTYGYDAAGNRTRQTDALGRTTWFGFDGSGRLTSKQLPGGEVYQWNYFANGQLSQTQDWTGNGTTGYVTTFGYDGLNRLKTQTPNGIMSGQSLGWDYDSLGRQYVTKRNGGNSVTRFFDVAGRVEQIQTPTGTMNYGYDADGKRSTLNFGGATTTTTYTVQSGSTTEQVSRPAISGMAGLSVTSTTNAAGEVTQVDRGNGVTTGYEYDRRGRVRRILHSKWSSVVDSFVYNYDNVGRRISETRGDGRTVGYSYDPVGRLTKEEYRSTPQGAVTRTVTYGYDAVGNRLSKTDTADPAFGGAASSYVYQYDSPNDVRKSNDRLLKVLRNDVVWREYQYDAAGRVTGIRYNGAGAYVVLGWTFDGRLASVGNVTYGYDGAGNRLSKGADTFLVDPLAEYASVVARTSGGSTVREEWLGNAWLGTSSTSGTVYGLPDALGSVRGIADNNTTTAVDYGDAFGKRSGSGGLPWGLNGQQFDSDTVWYYLRARYYDPETGRFLSQDPYEGDLQNPATLHRYTYAGNDPVNNIDPSGLRAYTQKEGAAIERAIQPFYIAEHATDIITFGKRQYFNNDGWMLRTKYPKGTPYRKPDIFNETSLTYMEIKPFSVSSIPDAVWAMNRNAAAYGPKIPPYPGANPNGSFLPDTDWLPPSVVIGLGGTPYFLINIGGVIFYSDVLSEVRQLILAAETQLVLSKSLTDMLEGVASIMLPRLAATARISTLVTTSTASTGLRLQNQMGMATNLALMGAY